MDSTNSSEMSSDSGGISKTSSSSTVVLSIECVKGSLRVEEWSGDMPLTGDIVEEIKIGSLIVRSPFKNGEAGVQRILHSSFKSRDTAIRVRVRRGSDEFAEFRACIVSNDLTGKKQYLLRSFQDPNYAVGFFDRTESECLALQDSRTSRMGNAIVKAQLQDGYVSYPWVKKMQELLLVPNSSCFLSLLLLPKVSDQVACQYNDLEDTLARANTWLNAAQASGVPIAFMNIQTESLLTKISGERASSTVNASSLSDLSNLANASLYGFEDYHGVDIGVVRAVRLWYSPLEREFEIEIKLKEDDTKLGFAISRTEEGFIYISSVIEGDDNAPSTRSGLSNLFKEATKVCKLLVVSRVSNQKILPWIVSSAGMVRSFDTISLSQKLSLHRHAKVPILIHVFLWDHTLTCSNRGSPTIRSTTSAMLPLPPEVIRSADVPNENQVQPLSSETEHESLVLRDGPELNVEKDAAGDYSFRFSQFSLPTSWV